MTGRQLAYDAALKIQEELESSYHEKAAEEDLDFDANVNSWFPLPVPGLISLSYLSRSAYRGRHQKIIHL